MFKKILSSLIIFIMGCAAQVNVPKDKIIVKEFNPESVYGSVARLNVKMIDAKPSISATGFAIDSTHLMTAAHFCVDVLKLQDSGMFEEDITMQYIDSNGDKKKIGGVKIEEIDAVNDICVLSRRWHNLRPLKFAPASSVVRRPEKVWIIGAPLGYLVTDFDGKIIDPELIDDPYPLKNKMIVSAAAAGGNSGSPVLNSNGEVVGMLVMGHPTFDHFSICTKHTTMLRFLKIIGLIEI